MFTLLETHWSPFTGAFLSMIPALRTHAAAARLLMRGGLKGMSRFCGGQDCAGISTLKNKHADASFCALGAEEHGGAK